VSVAKILGKRLGGLWTYDGRGAWHCDDGTRWIGRMCAGVDEFDRVVGPPQLWLYGDGTPRRAEEYLVRSR
jgi:hypothetical protein